MFILLAHDFEDCWVEGVYTTRAAAVDAWLKREDRNGDVSYTVDEQLIQETN